MPKPWEMFQPASAPPAQVADSAPKPWEMFQPAQPSAPTQPAETGDISSVLKSAIGTLSPLGGIYSLGSLDVGKTLGNIPKSSAGVLGAIGSAIAHPVDTASNLGDLALGAMYKALPQSVIDYRVKAGLTTPQDVSSATEKAGAVADFYKQRYGSREGFKQAIEQDPAGVAMDVSALFTGGGSAVSKIPGLARTGEAMAQAGRAVDPLAQTVDIVGKTAPYAGRAAANLIGGLGTHTGAESITEAARAGEVGGETAKSFQQNLREKVPKSDVLDAVNANIQEMGTAKTEAYKRDIAGAFESKKPLPYDGIDAAIQNARNAVVTSKGFVKNESGLEVQQKIAQIVQEAKDKGLNNAEDFDAIKQRIGGIIESLPQNEKTARSIATNAYNSVKGEIVKHAPIYADAMKDYHDASELMSEIRQTLSNKPTASVDTQLRKLQSIMRNNVNTSYGNRIDLVRQMEEQGGHEVVPALAGQALSAKFPRGLGGAAASAIGAGGLYLHNPLAIPLLAAQSPRLMGEAAYYTGKGVGAVKNASEAINDLSQQFGVTPNVVANALYQMRGNR